jgi:4-amino-4-deoxy-L-arabinose transferase-like glycosyltransferase
MARGRIVIRVESATIAPGPIFSTRWWIVAVQTSASGRAATVPVRARPPYLLAAIVLALSAIFLGFDLNHPIVLWDEARVVSSGVEMSHTGWNLVVTYNYLPDVWSTKPPLLIWLIAGCVRLFGANNWAVRLPSLVAALGTIALVMRFSWRLTRSAFVTIAAAALLVLSPGYFGVHAALGADYDTLLAFFTTSYLLMLFTLVQQKRPAAWRVALCAFLVVCACLTKGVEGVLPGVGAFIYVVVRGRWQRLFKTPAYVLSGLAAVVVVIGYYGLREHAAPGYLAALNDSELSGHFLHSQPEGQESLAFYPLALLLFFACGPLLLALFAAPVLRWPKVKSTAFLTYAGFAGAGLLIILSCGQTKWPWYLLPLYPILAIMTAIVWHRLLAMIPALPSSPIQIAPVVVGLVGVYMVAHAVQTKVVDLPPKENPVSGRYGAVFGQLEAAGYRRFRTLDGGVPNGMNRPDYNPQLRFYTLVWRDRGTDVDAGDPGHAASAGQGGVVVTCDPRYLDVVRALGPALTTVPGCAAALPGLLAAPRAGT